MCDKLSFVYGTAGYRGSAKLISEVVRRTAYFSGLRARDLDMTIGLMITASHNPPEDNGVKIIDFNGGMLPAECENILHALVNAENFPPKAYPGAQSDKEETKVALLACTNARVLVGTDTRESAFCLMREALDGLFLADVPSIIFQNHTTPQLHYLVRTMNDPTFDNPLDYVKRFRDAFCNFVSLLPNKFFDPVVCVDCANGVGALWLTKYFFSDYDLRLKNCDVSRKEKLNFMCGADHVKISGKMPAGFEEIESGIRCASLDGDADRLVYYYKDPENEELFLMDGDYIAALFALFISQQLKELYKSDITKHPTFSFGVVQTAYSNGNSMRFFKKLGIEPIITKTGVKHLEKVAHTFDIGIYFEANGHGTVCFGPHFHSFIIGYKNDIETGKNHVPTCIKLLYYFSKIVNEVVGDGIADFLAVEALLRYYSWTIDDWRKNTYDSLPSVQTKVPVNDRRIFCTSEDSEAILIAPDGLQDTINDIVSKYKNARAFVRPSGTESIVRILAEASTLEDAKQLTKEIEKSIDDLEPIVGSIYERFGGFFEIPERVTVPQFLSTCDVKFDDSDLPDVPDLSEYWNLDPVERKSIFAFAFDKLFNDDNNNERVATKTNIEQLKEKGNIERQKGETERQKGDAERQKEDTEQQKESTEKQTKKSNTVQQKKEEKNTGQEKEEKRKNDAKRAEDESIKNLEVIHNSVRQDEYSRLAMDAINMSLASKVMKDTVSRQEGNVLRLFDSLKFPPSKRSKTKMSNDLCDLARSQLEEIKALYIEKFQVEEGRSIWRFASDVNPVANGSWSFVPVRRVLDTAQKRAQGSEPTADDVEICRLALLLSTLLLIERPSLFYMLSMPNDVYVRLAELYLTGPSVFEDDVISNCVSLFINDYLFEKGRQNLLNFRLTASIALLDAFLPFFEDLLKHYEQFSAGDQNFALLLLTVAYMNNSTGDALFLAQSIWAPGRYVVRQMSLEKQKATPIIKRLKESRSSRINELEEQHYEAYARLLAMYAAAIRDESVTTTRNPAVFEIAAVELGLFVRRHTQTHSEPTTEGLSDECVKTFDVLVDVVRKATAGKLTL